MRNYLKNVHTEQNGHDAANFEYVFAEVLGRGIFATDKKEWQDHRKVSSFNACTASVDATRLTRSFFYSYIPSPIHFLFSRTFFVRSYIFYVSHTFFCSPIH